jgi:cation:H+ antiporter
MEFLLLIAGLVVLVLSGDYLVKFASGLAIKMRIPPVIVGLTIVSIGTSAPEIMASVRAALEGNPGITVGNVIGSNIANLALILGVTALIHPVRVDRSLMRSDWPVLMAASLGIWWFARNVEISQLEGLVLVGGAVVLLAMLYFRSRRARLTERPTEDSDEELVDARRPLAVLLGGIAAASLGLYYGSEWFVDGARSIAINNGVSDHIIGLTVVAFGTSVPELVASGIAAWKREPDLALGNLIGSNIFNIFLAAGISSSIIPLPVDVQALEFDFWWMTGIALLVGLMMMHRAMIHRWKGAVLLLIYLAYIGWIGGAVAAVAAV